MANGDKEVLRAVWSVAVTMAIGVSGVLAGVVVGLEGRGGW